MFLTLKMLRQKAQIIKKKTKFINIDLPCEMELFQQKLIMPGLIFGDRTTRPTIMPIGNGHAHGQHLPQISTDFWLPVPIWIYDSNPQKSPHI